MPTYQLHTHTPIPKISRETCNLGYQVLFLRKIQWVWKIQNQLIYISRLNKLYLTAILIVANDNILGFYISMKIVFAVNEFEAFNDGG